MQLLCFPELVKVSLSCFPHVHGNPCYQSPTGSADSCPTLGPLRALPFALPRSPPAPFLSLSAPALWVCDPLFPASSLTPPPPGIPFLSLPCSRLVLLPFTCENRPLSLFLRKVLGGGLQPASPEAGMDVGAPVQGIWGRQTLVEAARG